MIRTVLLTIGMTLASSSPWASAQHFPNKVVRIVSPYPPGIAPDIAGRALADRLSKVWGQQVIVEPHPGANGFIAISLFKKAAADGHTLLIASDAHLAINPNLFHDIPYDPEKDFVPLSLIYKASLFVAVAAQGPYRTISDLIAAAKANPGKINYSSPYIGSPPHLGGALFAYLTGTEMVHVAFKEGTQVYASVANGDVDWALGSVGSMIALIRAGKIKIIAVASTSRFPGQPDVPTVGEAGGPAGFEANAWLALLAPQGTPTELARRINTDVVKALDVDELKERLRGIGVDPISSTPEQLSDLIRTDLKVYGDIVKRTGVKAE
jgi:tripartite-type tricarboxylate transporter receptor subunit TctC